MNSDSKVQNGKKGNKYSLPHFWVRPHRNLQEWNDFLNGHMIPEEWKENITFNINLLILLFHVFFLLYYVMKKYNHLIVLLQMETGNVPDRSGNISVSIGPQYVIDGYRMDQKAIRYDENIV